jgi:hypothetical protein
MTTAYPAPSLPQPQPPAAAARAVTLTAQAAACAWAKPLNPAAHSRAVSQLHSVLRDLGLATRGLGAYQVDDIPPGPAPSDFAQHTGTGARLLLDSWQRLDGVLAAEGIIPPTDPDEPGTVLCQAARSAILAWRQPVGTAADRDATIRQLITATGFLSAAITALATYAPRRPAIDLRAAGAALAEAIAYFTAAIPPPEDGAPPGRPDSRQ